VLEITHTLRGAMVDTYATSAAETADLDVLVGSKRAARARKGWPRGVPRTEKLYDAYASKSYTITLV
jgi:hypothetical protein